MGDKGKGVVPALGGATTQQLLDELRLRGDIAMTVHPGTKRAVDGEAMSSWARLGMVGFDNKTLEAKRGE